MDCFPLSHIQHPRWGKKTWSTSLAVQIRDQRVWRQGAIGRWDEVGERDRQCRHGIPSRTQRLVWLCHNGPSCPLAWAGRRPVPVAPGRREFPSGNGAWSKKERVRLSSSHFCSAEGSLRRGMTLVVPLSMHVCKCVAAQRNGMVPCARGVQVAAYRRSTSARKASPDDALH